MNALTPVPVGIVRNKDTVCAEYPFAFGFFSVGADTALLSLRDEFRAAVTQMAEINRADDVSDEQLDSVVSRFNASCWSIANSPPAQTQAGRALKAAAAKQQLRGEFGLEVKDDWPDQGHELVWQILTELAGDEYFPSTEPQWEPPHRGAGSKVGVAI